jgi:hypothetical protein
MDLVPVLILLMNWILLAWSGHMDSVWFFILFYFILKKEDD